MPTKTQEVGLLRLGHWTYFNHNPSLSVPKIKSHIPEPTLNTQSNGPDLGGLSELLHALGAPLAADLSALPKSVGYRGGKASASLKQQPITRPTSATS